MNKIPFGNPTFCQFADGNDLYVNKTQLLNHLIADGGLFFSLSSQNGLKKCNSDTPETPDIRELLFQIGYAATQKVIVDTKEKTSHLAYTDQIMRNFYLSLFPGETHDFSRSRR